MFSFLNRFKPLLIVGLAVLFISNGWPGPPPSSSIGLQAATYMQDQTTQTDSLLTDYIVVEYV